MPELLWVAAGWFAGGFINGVAGFGAALIAMPLIAPFIDFSVAVPSCTMIVLTLNVQVAWTFRKHIQWPYLRGIVIGAVPGVLLSMVVLAYVSETFLKAGMGAFIAGYALWSLYADKGGARVISSAWGYLAGVLSSALGMAFGFNGPPLAAYIAFCGCPAKSVKGILGAGFIITGVCIVWAKAATGQVTGDVLLTYAAAVPAVILGSKIGIWLSASLNEYSYRKILFISLAAMGVRIVWTTLR
ncbi:MAG: sulfite exporter TauE/SafE family protein [Desulfobacter sp.]